MILNILNNWKSLSSFKVTETKITKQLSPVSAFSEQYDYIIFWHTR